MSDPKITDIKLVQNQKKLDGMAKELSDSGDWTITQILFQDIQAANEISDVVDGKSLNLKEQYKLLKVKVKEEYQDEPEIRDLLLESIPTYNSVRRWTKMPEWKAAVLSRIRNDHAFSNTNQVKVLNNILKAATSTPGSGGSIRAAELYFRLEGSLGTTSKEKEAVKDSIYERYKSLQKTLHSKK